MTQYENLTTYSGTIISKALKETAKGGEYIELELELDTGNVTKLRAFDSDEGAFAISRNAKKGDYVAIGSQDRPNPQAEGTFFHNIKTLNVVEATGEAPTTTQSPVAQPTTPYSAPEGTPVEWTSNTNCRIAWNSAVNNPVNAEPAHDIVSANATPLHIWLDLVDQRANGLYSLILRGAKPPVEEVEDEPEVDASPDDGIILEEL